MSSMPGLTATTMSGLTRTNTKPEFLSGLGKLLRDSESIKWAWLDEFRTVTACP
jgi:hypothetical protein